VDCFLLDIVKGKLQDEEEIGQKGMSFFGTQGPWYTVGYRMSVMVERRWGRQRLLGCMLDTRQLLGDYNLVAAERNRAGGDTLAAWSPELMESLGLATDGK
jgi:hypothetical protein